MEDEKPIKKTVVLKATTPAVPPAGKATSLPDREKPFVTIVLGETGVGKTYANLKMEIPVYLRAIPAIGKQARKVIIYDVNGDYEGIRALKASPEAIMGFVKQIPIEARRIIGKDELGRPLDKKKNYENAGMIIGNFINGLIILDDLDKYAVHSSKQDLVSMLMGNRHIGCHILISHQSWRKMSVTEMENLRYLRIHHALDDIDAIPAEKQGLLEYALCKIASLIVEEQYSHATNLYEAGQLEGKKYESHKAFFVYVDVRRKKIRNFKDKEETFKRAAYKYMMLKPQVIHKEIQQMIFMEGLKGSVHKLYANDEIRTKATERHYQLLKRYIQ